jgi:hypothetical protein
MRHSAAGAVAGLIFAVSACSDPEPLAILPVFDDAGSAMSVVANGGRNAAVPLSGDEEVPARATRARGTAIFHLSSDGSELHHKLIVANIENVVQSHIHLGAAGTNGPIVVFLYGLVAPGGGRVDGVLAEGTITGANFINNLAGKTMDDLVAEIVAGNAYVNVHTNDGVAPTNTGPGDFPGGEVRGQFR